jgi:aminopeptidase
VSTPAAHDAALQALAALCVSVGVNVQRDQELIVSAPIEARVLVRHVAATAYRAGAKLVTCLYDDPQLLRARFDHGGEDTLDCAAGWLSQGIARALEAGAARLFIHGPYPELLTGIEPQRVARMHQALAAATQAEAALTADLRVNWCAIPFVTGSWARTVRPDLAPDTAIARLWEDLCAVLRIDDDDPVERWRAHLRMLGARCESLQERRFDALHFYDGQTDLRIGLARGHRWVGGASVAANGVQAVCNLPTEEVFTCPHRERAEGRLVVSRPLALGGAVVEGLVLTFRDGQVVETHARGGQQMIDTLLATDEGARRLGEVGLVPRSSPVAARQVLFYNPLLDENAASHVALGQSYSACLPGDLAPEAAGANSSALHIDCMLGTPSMNVDGILPGGGQQPLMRHGEFTL